MQFVMPKVFFTKPKRDQRGATDFLGDKMSVDVWREQEEIGLFHFLCLQHFFYLSSLFGIKHVNQIQK